MSGLEAATQLWAAGDRGRAFEVVCGVWAESHDVELGELCEQISEQLVRARTRVGELSLAEQHAALMVAAKAGDRVAVHALLPWLTSVPRPKARQRIAFLAVPDPVLLRSLVAWLRQRPELNEVVRYLGDHRSRWLDSMQLWLLRDGPSTRKGQRELATRMQGLRAPPSKRTLSLVELDQLDALRRLVLAELSVEHRQADALYEAVCEHPRDDARRALLADFLLSRDGDDPRGELINLQLRAAAGPLPESARARERELLDLHGFRWLGPLACACHLSSVRFAGGFLVEVELLYGWRGDARFGAPGHPIWATVEVLEGGSAAIAGHEIMRSLRVLGCGLDGAEAVLRGPVRPTIEALSVAVYQSRSNPDGLWLDHARVLDRARVVFANLDAVPNLLHLRLRDPIAADPSAWQWIWQGPRAGLESVRLQIADGVPPSLRQWSERLRSDDSRIELSLDAARFCFTLLPVDGYRTVRVRDEAPQWRGVPLVDRARVRIIADVIAPAVGKGEVWRIEVVEIASDVEPLRELLRRRGLDDDVVEVVAA